MSSTLTWLPLGAFGMPAISRMDLVFGRTITVPSGIADQTSRVPGLALTIALMSAGSVVWPSAVTVDSAMPFLIYSCRRRGQDRAIPLYRQNGRNHRLCWAQRPPDAVKLRSVGRFCASLAVLSIDAPGLEKSALCEASDRDGSPVASDVLQHCETASVPSEQRPAIDNSVGQAAAGLWRFASVRFESQSDRVVLMGCFGECSVVAAIPPTPRVAEPASRWRGRPNLHSSICQRARSAVGPAV